MEIQHGSLVDTVIEYASVKFGVELDVEQVALQMRGMTFSEQVRLASAIKQEDDDLFSDMIDMSAVNEAGTISPTSSVLQTDKAATTKAANADRRTNLDIKALDDGPAAQRKVAGQPGNDASMGVEPVSTGRSVKDPQADAANAAGQAASLAQQNADRIKELTKKLIAGRQQ